MSTDSNKDDLPINGQDAQIAQYRAISVSAVVGLILGLLAPLAMLDRVLWTIPGLGILVGCFALYRIARESPAMFGRKAAIVGLTLSIFFVAAAPTDWFVYRGMVRREAGQFGLDWFRCLAEGQPQKADQLTIHPKFRQPLDDRLWGFYGEAPRWRARLEEYVARPLVRTLLALGPKAQVRYYTTYAEKHAGGEEVYWIVYAVTFDDAGKKKTFFARLQLQRWTLDDGRANWQVVEAETKPSK